MNRREVLKLFGVTAVSTFFAGSLYKLFESNNFNIEVDYPGMLAGHIFRDGKLPSDISNHLDTDILIVGSGVSALTCAWKLVKENYKGKITLVVGPEKFGNSSSTLIEGSRYPNGAHYLPLQNITASHTREILDYFKIITANPYADFPTYDPQNLVYSPMERFLVGNEWIEGNHQHSDIFSIFSGFINNFKETKGSDGNYLFTFPISKSSSDLFYLQKISFLDFLTKQGFKDSELLHYLSYCIRDDYGVDIDQVCAWAGLLYFAGRFGKAKNINNDTLLTWESGNFHLANLLFNDIKDKINIIEGLCYSINDKTALITDRGLNSFIKFNNVVMCSPLFITSKILKKYEELRNFVPKYSSWLVANYKFNTLPREIFHGVSLAYDNLVEKSDNLGFIFSSNQNMDIDRDNKVLTTYTNIPTKDFANTRAMLSKLSKQDLLEITSRDLSKAYGDKLYYELKSVNITVRGHAMPYPDINFLDRNKSLLEYLSKLKNEGIYLAHSDLSSISVFEEASFHGVQAALDLLRSP